jgi:hypothetical protein
MAQMTDGDLKSLISQEETQALGYHAGDLSREREKSLDYYHGLLSDVAAPPTGRSDVVSTDVRDAVDGMLPDLLDIFLSSDDVVKFEPQGPEDEQGSRRRPTRRTTFSIARITARSSCTSGSSRRSSRRTASSSITTKSIRRRRSSAMTR